jgi:hypothetical protein
MRLIFPIFSGRNSLRRFNSELRAGFGWEHPFQLPPASP